MNYALLGDLKFEGPAHGIEGMDFETGQDFAVYDRALGKPFAVPVGEKLRRVTLTVRWVNTLSEYGALFQTDIRKNIALLNEMTASGKAYTLLFSGGIYAGKYYLESIRGSVKKSYPNGEISDYRATLQLLEKSVSKGKASESFIRKESEKKNYDNLMKSVTIVDEQEKREYVDILKSKNMKNPLYIAYLYAKKVLL